jgi:hypothetical protein
MLIFSEYFIIYRIVYNKYGIFLTVPCVLFETASMSHSQTGLVVMIAVEHTDERNFHEMELEKSNERTNLEARG